MSRTEDSRRPRPRRHDAGRRSRRALATRTARPRFNPLSTDRGSEGHRVANCTDTRRFSVSRRSFQRDPLSLPVRGLLPSTNPRGPWLLAQALVLFHGPRPILIHVVVSTVLLPVRRRRPLLSSSAPLNYERWKFIFYFFFVFLFFFFLHAPLPPYDRTRNNFVGVCNRDDSSPTNTPEYLTETK